MCPHQFRLKYIFGFASPIKEEMGLGKSIHDATAELHQRMVNGQSVPLGDVDALMERHLHLPFAHLPFAGTKTRQRLGLEAHRFLHNYVERFGHAIRQVVMVEKPIEISAGGSPSRVGLTWSRGWTRERLRSLNRKRARRPRRWR